MIYTLAAAAVAIAALAVVYRVAKRRSWSPGRTLPLVVAASIGTLLGFAVAASILTTSSPTTDAEVSRTQLVPGNDGKLVRFEQGGSEVAWFTPGSNGGVAFQRAETTTATVIEDARGMDDAAAIEVERCREYGWADVLFDPWRCERRIELHVPPGSIEDAPSSGGGSDV